MPDDPQLLNIFEAAEFLGVSADTLYERVKSGRVPHIRLWRGQSRTSIRFTEGLLRSWLEERTVQARAENS